MEYIVISFLTALGKLIIICKLLGAAKCVRIQVWLDIFFTLGIPLLLMGTLGGAIIAVLSGIWFTCMLWFLSLFIKPQPLFKRTRS